MSASRLALLWALLAAAPFSVRAVEKCVSASGKVTYSEEPCPQGSRSSSVRGTPPAAAPTGAAQGRPAAGGAARAGEAPKAAAKTAMSGRREGGLVEVRYYDVQGSDYESLLAAIKRHGLHGEGEWWTLAYQYQPRRAGKACSVASLDTTLRLVVTLPRWAPPPGAPPRLVADWMRYVSSLRKHAEGHHSIGRDMQEAFRDSLAVTQARCEKLDEAVKSQFGFLLERYRAREKAYDFETAQGRTEGVEFARR